MLQEIHIIHHSHTDLGYTDAPQQAIEVQYAGFRRALELAEVKGIDDASDFRWTCEALGIVAGYLRRHPSDDERLARLVAAGRVEVCALPWNLTPALIGDEWQAMRKIFAPLRKRLGARVAMQCDVNGLSWGAIPGMIADGVEAVWFGMNDFSGGSPLPVPSIVHWEGPDGSRILAWAGFPYGDAHQWFHETWWRVGPVADAHNVWFHRPGPGDHWLTTPEGLAIGHKRLHARMQEKLEGYPYSAVALQATNQWRGDNDPPCEELNAFVSAWNSTGLTPRLVFSTPSRFLDVLKRDPVFDPPVVRGDWTDWWGDGSPSMPCELAWGQRAKTRLSRLSELSRLVHQPTPDVGEAWDNAFQSTEHTFGAYDSVVRPWGLRTHAGWCHKAQLFNRALQLTQDAECTLLRSAPDYTPAMHANGVAVVNTSVDTTGGWVEIGLQRWQHQPSGLRDSHGRIFPLEIQWQQEWTSPRNYGPALSEIPAAIWPAQPVCGRAWVPCDSGESRRLAIVTGAQSEGSCAADKGEDATWRWAWENGILRSLIHRSANVDILDTEAPWPFASLVWESYDTSHAWEWVPARDPRLIEARRLVAPPPQEWTSVPSHYGPCWRWRRDHDAWYAAEQALRLLPDGSVELSSRVYVKECLEPIGLWLALPLGLSGADPVYDSLGFMTRVGIDQLPNSCGEFVGGICAVGAVSQDLTISVDCTDTPIAAPGGLYARTGRTAARPERPHWYPCLLASWWATNFPHVRSTCIDVRHVLRAGSEWRSQAVHPLNAYPCDME